MSTPQFNSSREKFIAHNKLIAAMNEAKGYEIKKFRAEPRTPLFTLPDKIAAKDINGKHIRFIQGIVDRLADKLDDKGNVIKKGWNPLLSNVFCLGLGKGRRVNKQRRDMFKQCVPAFIKMSDILTGVLPRSNVTTLSDQCDTTTWGDALYDENGDRLKDSDGNPRNFAYEGEINFKKKSIHRMSLFLDWLEKIGLIVRTYLEDKSTGANLPMIIQLTDKFYRMCDVKADELLKAREQQIRWRKRTSTLLVPYVGKTSGEIIEAERKRLVGEIGEQRQEYRDSRRLSNRVKNLKGLDLISFARCRVLNRLDKNTIQALNEVQFEHKIKKEVGYLLNIKNHEPRYSMLH